MPFGVELPEHLGGEAPSTEAPVSPPGSEEPKSLEQVSESRQSEAPSKTEQELLDLDKLERFRFAGKEWTPKDLRNSQLMREDYTKKTQEVAEARKFADNFPADLDKVLKDPSLLTQLRGVYPQYYVDLAQRYLEKMAQGSQQSPTQKQNPDPYHDRISKIESVLSKWESDNYASEVKRIDSWLDNTYQKLGQKYPDADSEVISARAEVLAQSGNKITESILEKLYKQHDGEVRARFEKRYKSKVDEQLTTGLKGKDTGAGGGIPGAAPRGFKTLKEAKNQLLSDIDNSKSL